MNYTKADINFLQNTSDFWDESLMFRFQLTGYIDGVSQRKLNKIEKEISEIEL